jgi:hypothetical protein
MFSLPGSVPNHVRLVLQVACSKFVNGPIEYAFFFHGLGPLCERHGLTKCSTHANTLYEIFENRDDHPCMDDHGKFQIFASGIFHIYVISQSYFTISHLFW